ncbi:ABC transporter substrate-binding protein [Candidatus Micropelagos thuwalensis]|uniref:ABC transporter substrate-binding protein n=1 Tax=Candidatus Micropelagius thuwalensis TaxID=1397666 RepID=U2WAT0_9PROT|nr:helix-turn-helix transcriptional regulator [Candidatus Micropelagos thuwalensis]ERL46689.1 ABC transporter substrate-binding protein [Candidatus Micropelagos thuwalensis]
MALKDPSNIDKHICYKLKLRRVDSGMSQEALGEKVGLSFQQIQKYEKGANRISASRLFELTRILEVDISYFFEGYETSGSYLRMEDSAPIPKFLDFVSKNEGMSLNRAFTRIKFAGPAAHTLIWQNLSRGNNTHRLSCLQK